jgi:hypothetical protein
MTNIQSIAAGQGTPLVYYWPTPLPESQLVQSVAEHGGRCFLLDGDRMTEPNLLMQEFARSLAFPDYFGHNWDALEDCLGDLGWLDEGLTHFVIWLDHWERCASPMLLEVLAQAVTLWADSTTPLYVLLSGERNSLAALPDVQ